MRINNLTLTGRLTKDIDLKFYENNFAVGRTTLAYDIGKKNADGTWTNTPNFIEVAILGKFAEKAAETLHKGDPVVASGQLSIVKTEKDGKHYTNVTITGDLIKVDFPKKEANQKYDNSYTPPVGSDDDIPF